MADIEVKTGEIKDLAFTFTDADGSAVDVSGATAIDMKIATSLTATAAVTKALGDFTISGTSNEVATVNVSFSGMSGEYICQISVTLSATHVDVSKEFSVYVKDTLFA